MTLDEQETSVSFTRGDSVVYLYSAHPSHLRRMRGDDRFRETKSATARDIASNGDWGMFEIDAEHYDPLKGVKARRKPLTEAQRAERSEKMRRFRAEQLAAGTRKPASDS